MKIKGLERRIKTNLKARKRGMAVVVGVAIIFLAFFSLEVDLRPWMKFLLADALPSLESQLLTSDELAQRLAARLVPAIGTKTAYGGEFSQEGYEQLLVWEREITLSEEDYREGLMKLDFEIPCCGFRTMPEDYSQRCQCEHHLAMYGLAKKLIAEGWELGNVQDQLGRWETFFFPNETVAQELQKLVPAASPSGEGPEVAPASVGGC